MSEITSGIFESEFFRILEFYLDVEYKDRLNNVLIQIDDKDIQSYEINRNIECDENNICRLNFKLMDLKERGILTIKIEPQSNIEYYLKPSTVSVNIAGCPICSLDNNKQTYCQCYQVDEQNKLCFQCPENCDTCLQEKNDDFTLKCQSCSNNYYLLAGTGRCRQSNTF